MMNQLLPKQRSLPAPGKGGLEPGSRDNDFLFNAFQGEPGKGRPPTLTAMPAS